LSSENFPHAGEITHGRDAARQHTSHPIQPTELLQRRFVNVRKDRAGSAKLR
jgi:hypothetical protein